MKGFQVIIKDLIRSTDDMAHQMAQVIIYQDGELIDCFLSDWQDIPLEYLSVI